MSVGSSPFPPIASAFTGQSPPSLQTRCPAPFQRATASAQVFQGKIRSPRMRCEAGGGGRGADRLGPRPAFPPCSPWLASGGRGAPDNYINPDPHCSRRQVCKYFYDP